MLESFFKEGKYNHKGGLLNPTCPYPHGFTEKGTHHIEKIKDCGGHFIGLKLIF